MVQSGIDLTDARASVFLRTHGGWRKSAKLKNMPLDCGKSLFRGMNNKGD